MNSESLVSRLHQHRMWSNQRLLNSARQLTHEQLHQPMSIGQGSVWRTLTHLLAAEYVWLEALLGNEKTSMPGDALDKLPGNQQSAGAIESLGELCDRWSEIDLRWAKYLEQITADSLDESIYKTSISSGKGKRYATMQADVLLHLCTHAQYTGAQLVNMLRQLEVEDLPDLMLITMARSENGSIDG